MKITITLRRNVVQETKITYDLPDEFEAEAVDRAREEAPSKPWKIVSKEPPYVKAITKRTGKQA